VAPFKQAIDDRGTGGGHLRIELRALPAGPTVVDMLANAAFLLGLTLTLAVDADCWVPRVAFQQAHHNFYRAAQLGLQAELAWPLGSEGRVQTVPAAELVPRLLPAARQGLKDAGVAAGEADQLLAVVEAGRPPARPVPPGSAARWRCWNRGMAASAR
jgi:hypothetical protein